MANFDLGKIFDSARAANEIYQGTKGGGGNSSGGNTSIIDQILGGLGKGSSKGQNAADIGSILGAFSQGEKSNRNTYADARQNYDRMMLANQQDHNNWNISANQQRNANESDAWQKLQQAEYLKG